MKFEDETAVERLGRASFFLRKRTYWYGDEKKRDGDKKDRQVCKF
jgi:hypothetical protein